MLLSLYGEESALFVSIAPASSGNPCPFRSTILELPRKRVDEGVNPYQYRKKSCLICLHFDVKMQTQNLNLSVFAKTLLAWSVNSFCAHGPVSKGRAFGAVLGYFLPRGKK